MPELTHYCTGCGEIHGGKSGTPPEVRIAEINAQRDVEVARLSRSETREVVEGELAAVELETEAQVEEAVVKAEVLEEIAAPEPEPEPVVIVSNETDQEPADVPAEAEPPEVEGSEPAQKSSNPWW